MTETFDLVVIGSGAAAQSVASRCRTTGWTVAMVDKRPFGGTCALRGCDPKKVLVGAAAAIDQLNALATQFEKDAGAASGRDASHLKSLAETIKARAARLR